MPTLPPLPIIGRKRWAQALNDYFAALAPLWSGVANISASGANTSTAGNLTVNGTLTVTGTADEGTASANYVVQTGAGTGSAPSITAAGSDTNINLQLDGKGTGLVELMGASTVNSPTVDFTSAWHTYSPSYTGFTPGISPPVAKYQVIGKTGFFRFHVVIPSGSLSSTQMTVSFPFNLPTDATQPIPTIFNDGTNTYIGMGIAGSTGIISLYVPASGTSNVMVPVNSTNVTIAGGGGYVSLFGILENQ